MSNIFRYLTKKVNYSNKYAPIYFDSECQLNLVYKPNWGGFITFLTVYDLLILDIDLNDYGKLTDKILNSDYARELFYIHKTECGFHCFLVSKKVEYCSPTAIEIRTRMGADPDHNVNCLYYGNSVRLSKKKGYQSNGEFIGQLGHGEIDPDAFEIYEKYRLFLEVFKNESPETLIKNRFGDILKLYGENNGYFGHKIVENMAPMTIPNILEDIRKVIIPTQTWYDFLKKQVVRPCHHHETLETVGSNLKVHITYRVVESTPDYTVALHLQEYLWCIYYRDLLVVDYDNRNKVRIVHEFVRLHPEYSFRIVASGRGYHCFLTSHPVSHDSEEMLSLMRRLGSDTVYNYGCIFKGYGVRLNKKHGETTTNTYTEVKKIGGCENPRLLGLYKYHLKLANQYQDKMCHNAPYHNAVAFIRDKKNTVKNFLEHYKKGGMLNCLANPSQGPLQLSQKKKHLSAKDKLKDKLTKIRNQLEKVAGGSKGGCEASACPLLEKVAGGSKGAACPLTDIWGVGDVFSKILRVKGINTIEDLYVNSHLLTRQQQIGLKYVRDLKMRISRYEIDEYIAILNDIIKINKFPISMQIAGSYRRGQKSSGDMDFIIDYPVLDDTNREIIAQFMTILKEKNIILDTLCEGEKKIYAISRINNYPARRIDFIFSTTDELPFQMLYFTGSQLFNIIMRRKANKLGYKLNQYGIRKYDKKTDTILSPYITGFKSEEEIFNFLDMKYLPPDKRNLKGK